MNIKLLEDTLVDIKANGISRPLVETLENTIGEKFISSVFKFSENDCSYAITFGSNSFNISNPFCVISTSILRRFPEHTFRLTKSFNNNLSTNLVVLLV